jgi:serine phosphatase RsbU (regulator of sigma subunit)
MATVVLGEFRAAAVDRDNIAAVARQMDQRLRSYLGDEDFVTALIAQIGDDGTCEVVCCGHPPALVAAHDGYRYIGNADSLPLGLGADPQPASTVLEPGDRLLLYTDGLLEARGADGKFIELDEVAAPLTDGPLDSVLERIQASLKGLVGGSLADDLALLVAEYRPA